MSIPATIVTELFCASPIPAIILSQTKIETTGVKTNRGHTVIFANIWRVRNTKLAGICSCFSRISLETEKLVQQTPLPVSSSNDAKVISSKTCILFNS